MPLLIEQINSSELKEIINTAIDQKLSQFSSLLNTAISLVISRKVTAEILDVTPATINNYVSYGILKPVFKENCTQMNYKLSDVLILKDQLKTIPKLKKNY